MLAGVRKNALMVLTHLILNDMMKVGSCTGRCCTVTSHTIPCWVPAEMPTHLHLYLCCAWLIAVTATVNCTHCE